MRYMKDKRKQLNSLKNNFFLSLFQFSFMCIAKILNEHSLSASSCVNKKFIKRMKIIIIIIHCLFAQSLARSPACSPQQ